MSVNIRRFALIGGAIVGAFLAIKLLDLLMVWGIYSSIFQRVRDAGGLDDLLTGAISIGLTVIVLMLIPTAISAVLLRKTPKKLLLLGGAASAWMVLLYFLAQPKAGQYFNPMTGHAMYRYYREPDGTIKFLPLGYKYHPRYGTELEILTPQVMMAIDNAKFAVQRQAEESQLTPEPEPSGVEPINFTENFVLSPFDPRSNWVQNRQYSGEGYETKSESGTFTYRAPVLTGPRQQQLRLVGKRTLSGEFDFRTTVLKRGGGMTEVAVEGVNGCYASWAFFSGKLRLYVHWGCGSEAQIHEVDVQPYLNHQVSLNLKSIGDKAQLFADGHLIAEAQFPRPERYRVFIYFQGPYDDDRLGENVTTFWEMDLLTHRQ
jgi:hypothetical protein